MRYAEGAAAIAFGTWGSLPTDGEAVDESAADGASIRSAADGASIRSHD
jgi:hypothetical protein